MFAAYLEMEPSESHFSEEFLLILIEIFLIFLVFVLPFFFNFVMTINTIKISRNEKWNFFKEVFSKKCIKSFFVFGGDY